MGGGRKINGKLCSRPVGDEERKKSAHGGKDKNLGGDRRKRVRRGMFGKHRDFKK